jgi:NAD(P)-dependent dehydrogenase (short-subunit alcohol dehydrogenase family)
MGDLHGCRAVVTGANSGLGYETALALAAHGASVVLACRDHERATTAQGKICAEVADADVTVAVLDLADLASVRRFASSYSAERIDVLVNNAGVMAIRYQPPGPFRPDRPPIAGAVPVPCAAGRDREQFHARVREDRLRRPSA